MLQALLRNLIRFLLRVFLRPIMGPPVPLPIHRRYIALVANTVPRPKGTTTTKVSDGEVPLWRITSDSASGSSPADRPALLWAHGGAFVTGGIETHRGLAGFIANASGADVYLPEYRLAPANPAPAPYDDLFAAWQQMLDQGHDPAGCAIGGDSAGGALAVLTALAIEEMEVPGPVAMVLVCPWTDLSLSGPSIEEKDGVETMNRRSYLEFARRAHAGELSLVDPRVSPLFADLDGLPPTLVQVGEDDILLSDSIRFSDRAWNAGVEVELQRFKGMFHDFQMYAGVLKPAATAVEQIGSFLRSHTGTADPT